MKTKYFLGIFLLFLCIVSSTSCKDDHQEDISLKYENPQVIFDNEGRSIIITPFTGETTPLYIHGGDGNYTVTNSNQEAVQVNFDGEKMSFKSLTLGTALIKIEDKSNHVYILTITVKYWEESNSIYNRIYIIKGDDITSGDKDKLKKEIEAADMDKGYNFVYKEAKEAGGTIRIFDKNDNVREADFKKEHIKLDEENAIIIAEKLKLYQYWRVTIKDDNSIFYITQNFFPLLGKRNARSNFTPAPNYCYIKDVTEQYIQKYPAIEHVYIVYQVVGKRQ